METGRWARGCVAFLVAMVALLIHDVVGMYAHPEWGSAIPHVFHAFMPFMVNVVLSLMFLLVGFGIYYALAGDRRGYAITLAVGVFSVVLNLPVTYWRLAGGFVGGATICAVEAVAGAFAVYYAWGGLRLPRKEASPVLEPRPTA